MTGINPLFDDRIALEQNQKLALKEVRQYLKKFAARPEFIGQMRSLFGESFADEVALNLSQAWQNEDFSVIGTIQFLSSSELNGANGAYASATDTIYLSREFVGKQDVSTIASLLLEEIGHKIDRIEGLEGNDNLNGLGGNDTLLGGDGNDNLNGGAGNDSLDGGNGNDFADYVAATGSVTVNLETGIASGSDGNDTLVSIESIRGSTFNDNLIGSSGDDYLDAIKGNDTVSGNAGNDILFGQSGNDTISGGIGNDELWGEDGNDQLFGEAGNDYLDGASGTNTLNGGDGDDVLVNSFGTVFNNA